MWSDVGITPSRLVRCKSDQVTWVGDAGGQAGVDRAGVLARQKKRLFFWRAIGALGVITRGAH